MASREDHMIQTASGLWIPKQTKLQREQHAPQSPHEDQQDAEPVRDWNAEGQSWRKEPEINHGRQQFLRQRLEIVPDDDQVQAISLTRADLEWLIQKQKEKNVGDGEPQGLNLRKAILIDIDCRHLPLEGADFRMAQFERAKFGYAQLKGANFINMQLGGADFEGAQLEGANFRMAQLGGAKFEGAQLGEADFGYAQLEGTNFVMAHLKRTKFANARLKGAYFGQAQLERAYFAHAQLEGANFWGAQLKEAFFGSARIANASFERATIVTARGIGPSVADVTGWDEKSLPIREWSEVKWLGDEARANTRRWADGESKIAGTRFEEYFAATRAYRQVATAMEGMGRKEEAEKFAFRAQVMQRKMLWWSIWQRKQTIWQRLSDLRAWLFSWLLALLSGYGYRFGRSLLWYLGILLTFAWLYVHLSQSVPPHSSIPAHLSLLDACILSVSDMVGRGFFRQDVALSDPYAGWSVLEGMIGVFMDVILISTLTQRLFKK